VAERRCAAGALSVTGVVLSGGQSQRMGRDKALLELSGETLLARALRLLAAAASELLVVGHDSPAVAALGVRTVHDEQPGLGPLGGIATALRSMRTEHALVVACDMPLLQPALLRYLIALAPEGDAVVPRSAQGVEPLHAVYSVACLSAVEACLGEGARAVSALLGRVATRYVEAREWQVYDPDGLSFLNVNTPGEWQRIVERLARQPG
jgi:molybdopterin-guanine dinucleotide biosynthesis protein A